MENRLARKKLFLVLLFSGALLMVFALNHKSAWVWKQFHGRGLASTEESLNVMAFISPSTGFTGGSNYSGNDIRSSLTKGDAVIYKTADSGITWERHDLGKGAVEQIENVDGQIIARVRVHTEESFRELQSTLWRSSDNGSTWELVYGTKRPFHMVRVLFRDKLNGLAVFGEQHAGVSYDYSENYYISMTVDGGQSWRKVANLDGLCNTQEIFLYEKGLAYISREGKVRVYDCQKKIVSNLANISNLRVATMTEDESGNLWIIGNKSEKIDTLMKIDTSGQTIAFPLSMPTPSESVVDSFHVHRKSISMTVLGYGSILGVNHLYYRSDDSGRTWSKENIPFSLVAKPIAYYRENLVWAGKGIGGIQKRYFRATAKITR